MNRFNVAVPFLALTTLAASGCKDPAPRNRSAAPAPVSGSVKPEVPGPIEVSASGVEEAPATGGDAIRFDGIAHMGGCAEDHLGLGRGLLEGGQIEQGIAELERGVYDRPDDFDVRRLLGEVYRGTGELERAVGHLRAALEQVDDATTWQLLAQTYYELKANDASIAALRKVMRLEPTNPDPYRLLAKVYQAKHMWKESIEASEEAIARGSDSPWTYNNMGYAHLVLGRHEDAVRELEKAVSFDTGVSPAIWNNLGLAYEKCGSLRDAHAAFQAALAGNPNYVKAKVNLARTVEVAKAQGIDLGIRTADISRSERAPVPPATPAPAPELPSGTVE